MALSVQHIVRDHFDDYARRKTLPLDWHKAAQALANCRTEAMGGELQACPDEHYQAPHYYSCHHRACPRCAGQAQAAWLELQQQKLLDLPHAHIIFTLPHELLALWRYNRGLLIDLQFRAAQETLQTLLADRRYLGATPGFLLSLHTHGRDLGLHPHLHGLITCGGVDSAGYWQALPRSILLPVRVVQRLYRGKLLAFLKAALTEGTLALPPDTTAEAVSPLLQSLYRKIWNVRIERRYRHGRGVAVYLARYVKGGPLSERRLVQADANAVSFRYTSHRDGQRHILTLSPERFLERLFTHLPVPGKPTVRYYGLYSHRQAQRLKALRNKPAEAPKLPVPASPKACPHCGRPLVCLSRIGRVDPISYRKVSGAPRVRPTGRSSVTRPWPDPGGGGTSTSPLFFAPKRATLN